jgi:hypothetical protein
LSFTSLKTGYDQFASKEIIEFPQIIKNDFVEIYVGEVCPEFCYYTNGVNSNKLINNSILWGDMNLKHK